ncbi:MAG: hypothetical protein O2945_20035, partial [Planctomycetota bacterium]|nr:hypothetical protein [Planctomycetota bacterium]
PDEPEFCQNSQPPSTLQWNSESSETNTGQLTDARSRATSAPHDNEYPTEFSQAGTRPGIGSLTQAESSPSDLPDHSSLATSVITTKGDDKSAIPRQHHGAGNNGHYRYDICHPGHPLPSVIRKYGLSFYPR